MFMCHKEMVCAPQIETRQCQEGQGEEGAGAEHEKKENDEEGAATGFPRPVVATP